MDSKLKRLTISCMLCLIFLVLLLVLYVNREHLQQSYSASVKPVQTEMQSAAQRETFEGTRIGNDLYGFLNDEEFFDKEENKYEKYLKQKNTLSLIMTSIEKDLRIKVVDFDGNVVAGETFTVEVKGKGEYSDTDQDGIIYISGLQAGDYLVTLQRCEGYTVPESAARVNVKEKVEYVAIEDISMLIKTEDEIDPEVDDTDQIDMSEDTDKTEIKKPQSIENGRLGIDVSKWNKEIDWEQVKKAGVQFAIIRCGYRGYSTGSLVVDPYFEQNMRGAQDAGIDVGVYFFTQAVNEVEAVEEASAVLELIDNEYITYPVFIDTEGAGGNGRADNLEVESRTAVCRAFCDTIESAGYEGGVYASKNWYNNRLNTEKLEKYAIWMAEYRSIPTYEGYYNMWQYTSKGKINGIEGNVDLNISYLDVLTASDDKKKVEE